MTQDTAALIAKTNLLCENLISLSGQLASLSSPQALPLTPNTTDRPAALDADKLRGNAGSNLAHGAGAAELTEVQNALFASIEARLANEMLRLVDSVNEFARQSQLIGKEIPDNAHFCKLITSSIGLLALQLAQALRKSANTPIFLDDGAGYLDKMGLELTDLFREVNLDGRNFLAVAFIDQASGDVNHSTHKGDK